MSIDFENYKSPSGEYRDFIARSETNWEASAIFDRKMVNLQVNDNYLWSIDDFRKLIEHMQQLLED